MRPEPRRVLLAACGVLSVGLATVGIVLPLLPTTPFLLLAAACFLRSSDRLHRWLIHHRWLGPYIRNYRLYRALTLRSKVTTVVMLWATIMVTMMVLDSSLLLRLLLLVVGSGVTIHVLRYRTLTPEMRAGRDASDPEQR
jgi:uncharacterized membrane protein YbaN (DUF454 family)